MRRERLERLWRAFGNGLFLAIIGIGGTLMAMTVFPAIALATRDPMRRRRRIQYAIHASFRLYCGAIHALRVADVDMVGGERLRGLRGTLIVANHPSLLDVVMIMSQVPNVQCVVKGGLWRNPFFRLTVEGAGYIRNDLDPEALMAACVDTLKAGNNLIVFPEGTRSVAGQPMRLRRGFANVATLAGADVQLLTITCEPPILNKGNPWWRVPETRTRFKLSVGERLDIGQFLRYRYRALAARKLVSFVEHYYSETLGYGKPGTGAEAPDRDGLEARRFVA
ncbi:MAG: lysophospholipid acyltransferase family protein [Magnetospirillum sp.]|nr:lysophospholipid acyltransferase family protein [Magnetospirillum sp.]